MAASPSPSLEEATAALARLAQDIVRTGDPVHVARAMAAGRELATAEVVESLLDAAVSPLSDLKAVAGALRFRGAAVVAAVLGRLHAATDRRARRAYFQVAVSLAGFPDLHDSLVGSLEAALYDRRADVVRNAISLLAAIGLPIPEGSHDDLASSPHVAVRLAFTQVLGRLAPCATRLPLLCRLIEDEHPGVRLAAAVGLRAYDRPEARQALERCAANEPDAETRAVCLGALKAATETA
jgi:HEAT repeat protein